MVRLLKMEDTKAGPKTIAIKAVKTRISNMRLLRPRAHDARQAQADLKAISAIVTET
jgi:hypothetical protein